MKVQLQNKKTALKGAAKSFSAVIRMLSGGGGSS
jgi:hypothetical protein